MKRTIWTRALLLALCVIFLGSMLTLGIAAAEQTTETEVVVEDNKNSTNEELGGFFSAERVEWAISVTLQGMLMIFTVLALLWGVLAIFKVLLHDIPAKRAAKKAKLSAAVEQTPASAEEAEPVVDFQDDQEIVAAITAAIAVVLQGEEYKDQFASGFRVVSFTRKGGAWNKDN